MSLSNQIRLAADWVERALRTHKYDCNEDANQAAAVYTGDAAKIYNVSAAQVQHELISRQASVCIRELGAAIAKRC